MLRQPDQVLLLNEILLLCFEVQVYQAFRVHNCTCLAQRQQTLPDLESILNLIIHLFLKRGLDVPAVGSWMLALFWIQIRGQHFGQLALTCEYATAIRIISWKLEFWILDGAQHMFRRPIQIENLLWTIYTLRFRSRYHGCFVQTAASVWCPDSIPGRSGEWMGHIGARIKFQLRARASIWFHIRVLLPRNLQLLVKWNMQSGHINWNWHLIIPGGQLAAWGRQLEGWVYDLRLVLLSWWCYSPSGRTGCRCFPLALLAFQAPFTHHVVSL